MVIWQAFLAGYQVILTASAAFFTLAIVLTWSLVRADEAAPDDANLDKIARDLLTPFATADFRFVLPCTELRLELEASNGAGDVDMRLNAKLPIAPRDRVDAPDICDCTYRVIVVDRI